MNIKTPTQEDLYIAAEQLKKESEFKVPSQRLEPYYTPAFASLVYSRAVENIMNKNSN